MEPPITLINEVVENKTTSPSLHTSTITTSTTNNNNHLPQLLPPRLSPNISSYELNKDRHEPFYSQRDDNAFSLPKKTMNILNKKKKNQIQDNSIVETFKEEFSSGNLKKPLEPLSQQPSYSTQLLPPPPPPQLPFPKISPVSMEPRNLSISQETEILTTISESNLENHSLIPITISNNRSSSSVVVTTSFSCSSTNKQKELSRKKNITLSLSSNEGENNLIEVEREKLEREKKTEEEEAEKENNSSVAKTEESESENEEVAKEVQEEKKNYSTLIKTNVIRTTPINFGSSSLFVEIPTGGNCNDILNNILPSTSSPSFAPIHSDKSILGDYYSPIKEAPTLISVSQTPTTLLMAGDRYPTVITPLKNIKDLIRGGIPLSRETRFPSSGAYFAGKSGPMGDISGRLSPSKRPRFFPPTSNRNVKCPTPIIDTARQEKYPKKITEGWPTSPRRMKLASPRFKSLMDLMEEGPENPDQVNVTAKPGTNLKPNDIITPQPQKNLSEFENSLIEQEKTIPSSSGLDTLKEDGKKDDFQQEQNKVGQEQEPPADSDDDDDKEKNDLSRNFHFSKSASLKDILKTPTRGRGSRSSGRHLFLGFSARTSSIDNSKENSPSYPFKDESSGDDSTTKSMGPISEEEEEEEDEEEEEEDEDKGKGDDDDGKEGGSEKSKKPEKEQGKQRSLRTIKSKSRSERRISGSFMPLGEISELGEEDDEEEDSTLDIKSSPLQPNQTNEITQNLGFNRIRKLGNPSNTSKNYQQGDSRIEPNIVSSSDSSFPGSLSTLQSRRMPQSNVLTLKNSGKLMIISETEDEEDEEEEGLESSDNTSVQPISETSLHYQSDATSAPITPSSPAFFSTSNPGNPMATTQISTSFSKKLWKWPKRPFSPARDKFHEFSYNPDDDPSEHIGKVENHWSKKTLGQFRQFHKRYTPSILSKGFDSTSNSPLKESSTALLGSPISDLVDKKSPITPVITEELSTITEEEDEDIGVWSSEEVDLTDSGKEDKKSIPVSPSIPINPSHIEELQEPQGMKVSPEHLTIVGGTSVHRELSPNSSTASLALRSNPHSSSLAKHNAKPLFETTFTISNMTDNPLRYEILWPAFRFDVSPAYGIVQAKGVTVVKISVLMKHLTVGSKREEARDPKRLIGMLKGSVGNTEGKPLMGRTRILVLCENGERKEVLVDILQVKKKGKGELEPLGTSKYGKASQSETFMSRLSKTGGKSNFFEDIFRTSKSRTARKKEEDKASSNSTGSRNKGKESAVRSSSQNSSNSNFASTSRYSPPLRRSGPASRNTSPDGNKLINTRKTFSLSSNRNSRPSTPDRTSFSIDQHLTTSPQPIISGARVSSDESRQLVQRKNHVEHEILENVSCPVTTIRETNSVVFPIRNPTNKPISWQLTTATTPFLKKSESSSQQKITDEVFLITKTHGFLRPGHLERVDVSFRPLFVGSYVQNFTLEYSLNSEVISGASLRIQGEGKPDNSTAINNERRRGVRDFEVSEKEVHIVATRVGRRRSVRIKIGNPSNQSIRIRCKCEVVTGAGGPTVLFIPVSSVSINPKAFKILPVHFQPKEMGEIRGIVKLQAVGKSEVKSEVKIDVIADGVLDVGSSVDYGT
ncbi:hypothetical protein G9A89_018765 [Geosiphon pyriformis]|nr:hypothetical protein G9A89_018765 [Geosiphon pyriformis]